VRKWRRFCRLGHGFARRVVRAGRSPEETGGRDVAWPSGEVVGTKRCRLANAMWAGGQWSVRCVNTATGYAMDGDDSFQSSSSHSSLPDVPNIPSTSPALILQSHS
jgi:hypothetical protein